MLQLDYWGAQLMDESP